MLTNISTIKKLCQKYGFNFSKGLGQNFLINPSVCPKMAEFATNKNVIEVGGGFGILTAELVKVAKKVVCVEIDKKLLPVLAETVPSAKIINADILKIDINKLIADEFDGGEVVVCANLPYYIATPIIMHFLENISQNCQLIFMLQKEMAARLTATIPSRECGAITYAINYYGEIKKLFDVSRGSFYPSPNVDSTVVKISMHKKYVLSTREESRFFELVKKAFSQRRKQIANTIGREILDKTNISPTLRAENLSMEDFFLLARI
ncbi:ribosomal RNA small subunit methyltransferase A [Clostridia bacterium]|nr:ribosomal RNA small subunit methyltransferase A [Clostridia bacterium]